MRSITSLERLGPAIAPPDISPNDAAVSRPVDTLARPNDERRCSEASLP